MIYCRVFCKRKTWLKCKYRSIIQCGMALIMFPDKIWFTGLKIEELCKLLYGIVVYPLLFKCIYWNKIVLRNFYQFILCFLRLVWLSDSRLRLLDSWDAAYSSLKCVGFFVYLLKLGSATGVGVKSLLFASDLWLHRVTQKPNHSWLNSNPSPSPNFGNPCRTVKICLRVGFYFSVCPDLQKMWFLFF